MRRVGTTAALLMIALLLTACGGIPQSGPVREGKDAAGQSEDDTFTFFADGPQPGASKQDLLIGFLNAAASPASDYAVAREFLSPDYRLEWDPESSVTVDELGDRSYAEGEDDTITASITETAVVDASGSYQERAGESRVSLDYSFVEVDGEWRISSAPDGIVLDMTSFENVFSAHALMFFDPHWQTLVPDVRWFVSGTSTATRIVTELLRGPSSWLGNAVATAFPDGTRLTQSSVPVDGGAAQIDLSGEALSSDDEVRSRMLLQLSESLSDVAGVGLDDVDLTIDGQKVDVSPATVRKNRVDSRALVLDESGFGYVGSGDMQAISGLSDAIVALEPTSVTVDAANTMAAVGTASGVYSVTAGDDPVLVDGRRGLIAPALDRDGLVWSVPGGEPSALVVVDEEGETHDVSTSWPEASRIASLSVSRDGTRVLALVTTGDETQLLVAGIARGADGVPVSIGEPLLLSTGPGDPVSATWVDDRTVAVLTDDEGDGVVLAVPIGGPSTRLADVDGAVDVIGSNTEEQIRVLTADGELMTRRGNAWQSSQTGVTLVARQLGTPGS